MDQHRKVAAERLVLLLQVFEADIPEPAGECAKQHGEDVAHFMVERQAAGAQCRKRQPIARTLERLRAPLLNKVRNPACMPRRHPKLLLLW